MSAHHKTASGQITETSTVKSKLQADVGDITKGAN